MSVKAEGCIHTVFLGIVGVLDHNFWTFEIFEWNRQTQEFWDRFVWIFNFFRNFVGQGIIMVAQSLKTWKTLEISETL